MGGNTTTITGRFPASGTILIYCMAFSVLLWVVKTGSQLVHYSDDNAGARSGQSFFSSKKKSDNVCSNVCIQRRQKRNGGVDLLDRSELIDEASKAKDRLIDNLKKDYGEYFEPIFVDDENGGYRPFKPMNEVSMKHLKRKLMIKVLSMQSALKSQDSDFHGCDCSDGKDEALTNDVHKTLDPEDASVVFEGIEDDTTDVFEKYVWATGGHSASAGHGNLYNESYTAYMEGDLKDVFGSVGIEFEGRNYAMGGTSSATLMSMCHKEVFGEDIDFFSWDYGMTDGKHNERIFHYTYRGAISPSRPAMMVIHYGGRGADGRVGPLKSLEKSGMPLFHMENDLASKMKKEFPDSAEFSEEALKALPEYVRNYKCGTAIEKGDPHCGAEKFSKWGCVKRHKQTSWHPGFKDHAKDGHGLALFLVEALLGALRDLNELKEEETANLLGLLLEEDIEIHMNFTNAEPPENPSRNVVDLKTVNEEITKAGNNEPPIDHTMFMKGRSMCHTSRLPSETRFRGILMDTDKVGKSVPAGLGLETYYVGVDINKAEKVATTNQEMRIVYSASQHEPCNNVTLKPDYPDSFFVNSLDGWAKLRFPNDSEKRFYRYNPDEHEGIIVFHLKKCDWGKCPKNFLTVDDYPNKSWKMRVNGKLITRLIQIDDFATIAKGDDGFRFEPDENGQYLIEVTVKEANKYLEFHSFVLW